MSALVDRLIKVGPHAGAHRVALRATVSNMVPLLVLLAVDRQRVGYLGRPAADTASAAGCRAR